MGRPPIGRKAMTPAERQRKRRGKVIRAQVAAATKGKRDRAKDKAHAAYIPKPPGLTYWEQVTVQTAEGERTAWAPKSRPLAACHSDLTDGDVLALLEQLEAIARERGLKP